jgi:hypothetical protein
MTPQQRSRKRGARLSGCLIILCSAASLGLAACSTLRLYDAGRSKAASEATAIAREISTSAGAVYEPMADNLDAVRETQKNLRDLSNKHRFETFKRILARQSADELADRLTQALAERADTIETLDSHAAAAAEGVNAALDREEAITKANNEAVKNKSSIEEALARVKKRLDWIEKVFNNLYKVEDMAGKAGLAEGMPSMADGSKSKVVVGISKARAAIGSVESDQRVEAAVKLLKQAVQEIAASEQDRVLEMKRHLAEISRLSADFTTRDRISICILFVKTIGELYPALKTETRVTFENLVDRLGKLRVGDTARYECLGIFAGGPQKWPITDERRAQVKKDWTGGKLVSFVAADVNSKGPDTSAPRLVAALGVFLFHEREYFETVRWDLAREHHRHSIRLSKVNAQERAQLVHQLAQALEIYHQGGIKPEAMAEILLMAGQVGALTFIGVQQ